MGKRDDAIRLMNDLGTRQEPFLFIVDFEMNSPIILPVEQAEDEGIRYSINGYSNSRAPERLDRPVVFGRHPIPFVEYRLAFDKVHEHLRLGNSYLLNLTFPTRIETDLTLDEIFRNSSAKYRLLFRDSFVVFSPEVFVQIRHGVISSFPMKGTIDASIRDAEARILSDAKEIAEHTTIVDLIRNDLSTVAKRVRVDQFRYIDRIRTNMKDLLQVSSRISGDLPPDYRSSIGTILFSLLPAGSVTGAPKRKTVDIIKAVESCSRGYYTGVFGYFDGSNLDSGVMIRFIEKTSAGFVYRSGGGITVSSNVEQEYQELVDKVYVPLV